MGLNNTGQIIKGIAGTNDADIDAVEGWDLERGLSNQITIAVIDSGIDRSHPDLTGSLWQNTDEIAGNGVDDDSNGYIDDTEGYNFAGISQLKVDTFWTFGRIDSYERAQWFVLGKNRLTDSQYYCIYTR